MYRLNALVSGEWTAIAYFGTFTDALRYQLELLVEQPELLTDIAK